jgi:hypothetical protein
MLKGKNTSFTFCEIIWACGEAELLSWARAFVAGMKTLSAIRKAARETQNRWLGTT